MAGDPVSEQSLTDSKEDVFTITITDRDGSLTMVGDALWIIDARGRHIDTVSEHRLAALRTAFAGQHDPTGEDHLTEMMRLAEQRDGVLDILDEVHAISMSDDVLVLSRRILEAIGAT